MIDNRVKATREVLQLVERVHRALQRFHADGVTDEGVLAFAHFQRAALDITREELAKAILTMDLAEWEQPRPE